VFRISFDLEDDVGNDVFEYFLFTTGLQRCGKSCRLRWFNYLRPDIKRGKLSPEEEQKIIKLQAVLGNR